MRGGGTVRSARRTRKPSGVVVSTSAPLRSRSRTQRLTLASVAAPSRRYAEERRAEGGARSDPLSVATRLRRPSGQVSDATACTIAAPMSSGRGGGLEDDVRPRVGGEHTSQASHGGLKSSPKWLATC